MAFRFLNLDETTRSYMAQEVERDSSGGILYLSPRLSDRGRRDWPKLLLDAARGGDESSLAEQLRGTGRLKETEYRQSRPRRGFGGQPLAVKVPATAAMTLADGEFNRFYIRGICLLAIESGMLEVTIYRAKHVNDPRPDSLTLIGRQLIAASLLEDLRTHVGGEEPHLHVPGGPNSGLSVHLPTAD